MYILAGRPKGTKVPFTNLGPYEYPKKSQFGNLARIKRDNPSFEIMIADKRLLEAETPA